MALPSYSFDSKSGADSKTQSAFDNSGFVVNLGHASQQTQWLMVALAVGAVLWLMKRKG